MYHGQLLSCTCVCSYYHERVLHVFACCPTQPKGNVGIVYSWENSAMHYHFVVSCCLHRWLLSRFPHLPCIPSSATARDWRLRLLRGQPQTGLRVVCQRVVHVQAQVQKGAAGEGGRRDPLLSFRRQRWRSRLRLRRCPSADVQETPRQPHSASVATAKGGEEVGGGVASSCVYIYTFGVLAFQGYAEYV